MKVVRLSAEAIDELVEAAAWYRARRPGLGSEFLAAVDRVLPLIGTSPAAFPRLLDLPAELVIRRALLPRFPYALIFMDLTTNTSGSSPWRMRSDGQAWLDRVGDG